MAFGLKNLSKWQKAMLAAMYVEDMGFSIGRVEGEVSVADLWTNRKKAAKETKQLLDNDLIWLQQDRGRLMFQITRAGVDLIKPWAWKMGVFRKGRP